MLRYLRYSEHMPWNHEASRKVLDHVGLRGHGLGILGFIIGLWGLQGFGFRAFALAVRAHGGIERLSPALHEPPVQRSGKIIEFRALGVWV